MPLRRFPALISALVALLLGAMVSFTASGCGKSASQPKAEAATAETYFPIKVGDRTVRMQLALLDSERTQGVMFRPGLGANDGMLFIERYPRQLSFWMQNVSFPLDIGYFNADGVLQEIHPMYARDTKQVTSASRELKYALEMNLGWFAAQGVKPGAKLDVPAIKAAIEARGFLAERWGVK